VTTPRPRIAILGAGPGGIAGAATVARFGDGATVSQTSGELHGIES